MFAGHLGAGLLLKRAEPKVGLGTLFFAVMFLDCVLWVLVLGGIESIQFPAPFRTMLDARFNFPYSHGLVASIGWAIGAALIWRGGGNRASLLVGLAVFSHFILDWLVHVAELPLAGVNSSKIGLGLWNHPVLAWIIEGLLAGGGVIAYCTDLNRTGRQRTSVMIVMAVVMSLTVAGQATHSPPPPAHVMAITSLVTIAVLTYFAAWIDRKRPVSDSG